MGVSVIISTTRGIFPPKRILGGAGQFGRDPESALYTR